VPPDLLPPGDFPSDFLQLALNPPGPGSDFVGFEVAGLELLNVRMFWIENWAPSGTPDFLDSQGLPGQLPTLIGRLALDFGLDDTVFPGSSVFYDGLVVAPVVATPEPSTLSLLGVALLGFAAARRRRSLSPRLGSY
jgi:PEP-CTERM motif